MISSVTPSHYREIRHELAANPRTWLITGVAGFIGSYLLEDLLALGQTVIGLDDFSTGYRANLDDVVCLPSSRAGTFRFIEGDIRDIDTWRCRAVLRALPGRTS